jgi:ParB family transcriptional regulator, chromosome partitioning protein
MDFGFISIREIDLEDGTFEIRGFANRDRLHDSLARFGILAPPWIWKRGGQNIVVDGFKRLRWAGRNGIEGTVCRIFPESSPVRELWERKIEKRIFEPDINLAEKARIVSVMLNLYPSGDIPGFFLTALNLSPRPELLRNWAGLAAEEQEILEILASGDLAERAALEIADWDRESRVAALNILRTLRCSASIQLEIIERIDEIAIREDKPRNEVINDPRSVAIFSDGHLNHRQKTQALRDLLGLLRFPMLRAREQRFQESLEALALPHAIRIVPPPAFEGNNWRMELSFSNAGVLRDLLAKAVDVAASKGLDGVLETPKFRTDRKDRR